MKHKLILTSILALLSSASLLANERIWGWCEKGGESVVTSSVSSTTKVQRSYPSCTITVYVTGSGGTKATIYSDNNGTPLSNPFTANSIGYWYFYIAPGHQDVQLSGTGFSSPFTLGDIQASGTAFIPNAKDFGAKCDGVTDDTASLQAAITASTGGTLLITPGVCVSGTLTMPSNTALQCAPGVTLKLKDGTNASLLKNSDQSGGNVGLYLSGCILDMNNAGQSGTSIPVSWVKVDGSYAENLTILGGNIPNDGYSGTFTSYDGTYNVFKNIKAGDGVVGGGGLTLEMGSHNTIKGGVFSNSQNSGIVVDCSPFTEVTGITAYSNWGSNVSFNSEYGKLVDIDTYASRDQSGLTIGHSGMCADGATVADGSYTSATNVTSRSNHTAGVLVQGVATHGVDLVNIQAHNNGTSFGNGAGILTADTGWNVNVTNANLTGNQWGIFSGFSKQNKFVNISASGNLSDGVRLFHTTDTSVLDSVIFNNGQAGGANAYGVSIIGNDSLNCIVSNNRIYDDQGSPTQLRALYMETTDTFFLGNILQGSVAAVSSPIYADPVDLRRMDTMALTITPTGIAYFPTTVGTPPTNYKIISAATPIPQIYIAADDFSTGMSVRSDGAITAIGTSYFNGPPGGAMPSWSAAYSVLATGGNWTVNAGTPVARAAATTQTFSIVALPAGAYVSGISAKTTTACTGVTAATINAFGDTTSGSTFKGSIAYDLTAAVTNTNIVNPQITQGSGTFAANAVTVTVGAGAQNVSQIADGCAFKVWIQWSKRQ